MPFAYYRKLTIDHTQCGSADSASFPVLVYASDPTMRDAAHGGHVQRADGSDILFFSDIGITQIPSEVDYYDNVNGVVWMWVQVANVSHTVDTVFYVLFGNSAPPARTANPWIAAYKMVLHLPNGSTLSASDSTGQTTCTIHSTPAAVAGQIDGGVSFDGTNGKFLTTTLALPTTDFTYSFWANSAQNGLNNRPAGAADAVGGLFGSSVIWGYSVNGKISVIFRQGSNVGTGDIPDVAVTGLNSGWHHIAVVMSSSLGGILYYDGVQVGANSAYKSITTGGQTFTIGRDPNQGTAAFNGGVDEVRVAASVLPTSWILKEFNNQSSPGNIGAPGFLTWGSETPIGQQTLMLLNCGS